MQSLDSDKADRLERCDGGGAKETMMVKDNYDLEAANVASG